MYKRLQDCFWWPNLYTHITYFIYLCLICQLQSKQRPVVPLLPTWSTAVMRKFFLDTTQLDIGLYGMHYVLKAVDDVSGWPEARTSKKNNLNSWVRFLFEDVILQFSCIPIIICNGGLEFKGATRALLERYGVSVILSSPYHPQGNTVVERSHQTFINALLKSCGTQASLWPCYLHSTLLAVRTTTQRSTGYMPYYLVYGQHPVFLFDILDRSWQTLEWDTVDSTEELLAVWARQIAQREEDVGAVAEELQRTQTRVVDDFMRRNATRMTEGQFNVGAWVLKHKTWLDAQHGHKSAL